MNEIIRIPKDFNSFIKMFNEKYSFGQPLVGCQGISSHMWCSLTSGIDGIDEAVGASKTFEDYPLEKDSRNDKMPWSSKISSMIIDLT